MKLRLAGCILLAFLVGTLNAQVPASSHVIVVVEENHNYTQIIGQGTMPYLSSLANQYGLATQYYANTHPSIGNYFMMTTGQIITNNDSYNGIVTADNLVRHLIAAGKTWKCYAQSLPYAGYTGGDTGAYARRHNPFSYLTDVYNSQVQKLNMVPFTQFATDLSNNALPDISFIVPDVDNDAHDGSLQQADAWLQANVGPVLANSAFQQDGILIITFDESSNDNTNGGGRVVTVVTGPYVKPGSTSSQLHQHESLLRTIMEAVGLTSFPGAAATTTDMQEFFGQVTLTPTSLAFGNQGLGTTSSAQTATLTNNQSSSVTGISIAATGDFGQTSNCGSTLAANSSCTINVTFTPTAVGARTGNLTVTDSAGTQTTTLTGTGVDNTAPTTQITSPSNNATVSGTVTVTATASDNVGVTSLQLYIDGSLASTNSSSPLTYAWNTTTVTNGAHTLYSKASDAAGNVGTSTVVNVTVNNQTQQSASLTPSSLTFPTQGVGSSSSPQILTLTNTGNTALTAISVSASGDYSQNNTCGTSLAANTSCTISVVFTPTNVGTLNGAIVVTDGAGTQTSTLTGKGVDVTPPTTQVTAPADGAIVSGTITVSATATDDVGITLLRLYIDGAIVSAGKIVPRSYSWNTTAVADGPHSIYSTAFDAAGHITTSATVTVTVNNHNQQGVTLSPTSLSFGNQNLGTSSSPQVATLTNTQNTSVTGVSIAATGDFGQSSNCGTTLAANSSCTITVTFTPTATGTRTGTLTVTDSAGVQTATLSGTGVDNTPPTTQVTAPLNGATVSGTTTVTATASDNVGVTSLQIYIDGGLVSTGSSSPLSYSWNTTTASNGTHTIYSKASDAAGNTGTSTTVTVTVNNQTQQSATLSPTTIVFSNQAVNTTSASRSLTLTNNGPATLTGISISAAGDFAQSNNCGTSLATSSSCTILATFTPTTIGVRTGTITVTDGAGTQSSSLSGRGVDVTPPTVQITSPSNGATVSGTVTVAATADDDVAINILRVYIDGNIVSAGKLVPRTYAWNTLTATNGAHTITATAQDTSGNTTTVNITVYVNN